MKSFFRTLSVIACFLISSSAPAHILGQAGSIRPSSDPANLHGNSKREQWFQRGRILPGHSTAGLRYSAHRQKMQMRAARAVQAQASGITEPWVPLGPAPLASDASGIGIQDYNWVSGRATSTAIDPADSSGNTVYVGGAYGGVWKSTNAGPLSPSPANVVWAPLIDNQATLAVGSIAIQPQLANPDPTKTVILVGTGETNGSVDSYYGLGILRSADAGATWTLISQDTTQTRSFAGLGFSKIAFSTSSPDLVVAAAGAASEGIAEGLENPVAMSRGIYYSTDSGSSWTYASVSDGGSATSPGSASSVVYNAVAGEFFAALSLHGFYSSSDGIHWARLANQPGSALSTVACPAQTASFNSCPIYRGEISVAPGRNEMYIWYVDANDTDQGIWQSTNGGSSWTQISDAGITNCGDVFGGCGTSQGSYNLELAAVPDGTATDLYAGAVNLYKCSITNASPTCTGTAPNTFLNLTHVYGCSSIARVHPNQHAIASLLVNNNTEDVLYFANDGGIYRALDGYTDLTTGTCGGGNQFDSLNQTLGSMTQLISFSQSSTDPNVILGGAGDNGSPASTTAEGSSIWANVNAGDGGYAAISPANEDEWFASTPPDSVSGINIFSCALGIGCHTDDFVNNQVVSSATVGGDTGAFYPPYIFDPHNSGELLVGTCRVWRGSEAGGGFTVLSNNFESGGDAICSGGETNLVRSLAAGGALDANGFSNVIYAGTDGVGPDLITSPAGGHVWASTNAAGGSLTWADQTGAINPSHFPISGIAIDSSDVSGLTAYVTIMGFHVSHVWQTIHGGASWTDFTANLPDVPVNAIVVDPGTTPETGMIYVGTDVGVFSSSTGGASWSEVGPGSGLAGYLPNVAVTALQIFNYDGVKRLRASTYGRGIWEVNLITTPDFQMSVSGNPLTAFVGDSAIFSGTITALNGYASEVNLRCVSGTTVAPPNCLIAPSSPTPVNSGTALTVTASGPAGDYLFNLHGIGTDAATVARDLPLELSVVDFNLTVPSPASIAVTPPNSTAPMTFQVTAAGAFNGVVSLSCLGLPAGTACNFMPASGVNPTSASPVNITLTISTAANTPTGTFSVMILGTTAGGPNKPQALTMVVNAAASPDYTVAISNPTLTAAVNTPATFNGTLTSLNGYNSTVNLSCGAGAPPSCLATPSIVTPTTSGEPFTVTVSSGEVQSYNFNIVAQGTDASSISHASAVSFTTTSGSNTDFSISNTSGPQAVPAGSAAQYVLTFIPVGAATFANPVSYTCSSSTVPLSSCSFSPVSPIAGGSDESNVTLTVTTTAAIASVRRSHSAWLYGAWLPVAGLLLMGGLARQGRRGPLVLSVLPLFLLMVACGGGLQGGGGGGEPGTPPGNYTVTVNANEGSISHSLQVTLTVQ
jgi:hypothetical protein